MFYIKYCRLIKNTNTVRFLSNINFIKNKSGVWLNISHILLTLIILCMVSVGFVYLKVLLEWNYICTVFEFNLNRLFEGKELLYSTVFITYYELFYVAFLWKEAPR